MSDIDIVLALTMLSTSLHKLSSITYDELTKICKLHESSPTEGCSSDERSRVRQRKGYHLGN